MILILSISGVFKGYGFACFKSKVAALQARHVLEGQEVRGHAIDCGWIKEGTHQLADLQSKVGGGDTNKLTMAKAVHSIVFVSLDIYLLRW